MLCKECKEKPVVRGIKEIKCFTCGAIELTNYNYSEICHHCSDEHQMCEMCGKNSLTTTQEMNIQLEVEQMLMKYMDCPESFDKGYIPDLFDPLPLRDDIVRLILKNRLAVAKDKNYHPSTDDDFKILVDSLFVDGNGNAKEDVVNKVSNAVIRKLNNQLNNKY